MSKQEKRRLCRLRLRLGYSAAAVHSHHFHSSLHNEPETSKLGLKGKESEDVGGREIRKRMSRERRGDDRNTKIPVFVDMYSIITVGYLYLNRAADRQKHICMFFCTL